MGEAGVAVWQTSCVWNSEAEKVWSDVVPWDANCDKAKLFLGKHTPDISPVLVIGQYPPVAVASVQWDGEGYTHDFFWTSAPCSFIPLLPRTCMCASVGLTGFNTVWRDHWLGEQILSHVCVPCTQEKKAPFYTHNPLTLPPGISPTFLRLIQYIYFYLALVCHMCALLINRYTFDFNNLPIRQVTFQSRTSCKEICFQFFHCWPNV